MLHQSYSKKPINEIMQQLDELGGSSQVRMMENCLVAITNNSQDINKYTIEEEQSTRQFVVAKGHKKKYYYQEVHQMISKAIMAEPLVQTFSGFNTNVILVGLEIDQILRLLPRTDGMALSRASYHLTNDKALDLLSGNELPLRTDPQFFTYSDDITFSAVPDNLVVTRITYPNKSHSELRIIEIPRQLITNNSNSTRSQLIQLLEFLRKNKDKFGKDYLNKLFIKKNRAVSVLIDTVFENSLNWVVNGVGGGGDVEGKVENLEFVSRWKGLPCFVKRVERRELRIKPWQESKKPKSKQPRKSTPSPNPPRNNILIQEPVTHQTQVDLQKSQLSYCRSLQRKTHKYSVPPTPPTAYQPQPNKLSVHPSALSSLPSEEQISILKSAHMIQISKYHQTIQSLNAKLIAFAQEKGVEEICNIYEREIMQLELKVEEMRKEMGVVCAGEEKGLKAVVGKLNEQVGRLEKERAQRGRREVLGVGDGERKEVRGRLEESEKARAVLAEELKELSKRLQIREQEVSSLNKKIQNMTDPNESTFEKPSLNVKTQKQYYELVTLLQQLNNGNGMSYVFIRKRVSNLFQTLSLSKKTLVECHDFLIQLQNQLEAKISSLNPTLVLDCNRFIRGFLMKCLQVQE